MKVKVSELREKVLAGVVKLGYKDSGEIEIADAIWNELTAFVVAQ